MKNGTHLITCRGLSLLLALALVFALLPQLALAVNNYTIGIFIEPEGAGTVTRSPLTEYFDSGTEVTLTATPADDSWVFQSWEIIYDGSGKITSTEPTVKFTVDSNITVHVHFTPMPETSGTCGEKARWTFDAATGTLTISGSGPIELQSHVQPWERNLVKKLIIEDGITEISGYAFQNCSEMKSVSIPDSVVSIGEWAFSGCMSLLHVTVPASVTEIKSKAFGSYHDYRYEDNHFMSVDVPIDGFTLSGAVGSAAEQFARENGIPFTPVRENPFLDVSEGVYYFDPVLWAVNHEPEITNGIDPTHFGPDRTCTRAQVVTFLWRAMGCPEPTKFDNPFTDVTPDRYYYKAVLWAVQNGITNGTGPTAFSPDKGCTRGQVVTFLWRVEGQPKPLSGENPFTDVSAGQYYCTAVLWANSNRITTGTSPDKFSPDATCTRGQIVTFLYRDLGQINKLLEGDFLMYAENVFMLSDRGVVLGGTVEHGVVRTGDKLRVLGCDPETNAPKEIAVTCVAIEQSSVPLDKAGAGESIYIQTDSMDKDLFQRGCAIVGASVPMRHVTGALVGTLYKFTTEEGGRHTPIPENDRPLVFIGTVDAPATVSNLPDGMLLSGNTAYDAHISGFETPVVVYLGQKLILHEGGKTVGEFTVTEIRS